MTKALLVIDVQNAIVSGTGTPDRQPLIDAALDDVVGRLRMLQEKGANGWRAGDHGSA